mmetsp:Transcript_9250/g.19779  ORF Transcript_9250/g.19779 Transcript_9250/m.19779 type:complete len:379 (-) Transcript_9250:696-1832(-)|eukprot:CAMPEP_0202897182 /NCGR_PEP_ID=MMETSP1392-20130828/6010_1 /ASSEMBLY_ACC=CAM_ASM_000868 /TAXON_ID=225041 /ORGANISM="Chlamydomonas chlamydogama, Strain SAG 11-48b" /LENGTH=378 /DNA_ID=CAMNT_0049582759 /DNA_START=168 /DNA_END=1304 /DNA_ORIENTATION=-
MSFVYLGGDDTTKPTYFEVCAADKLVPGLKAAAVYIISVLSQRTPWLHRVLAYEDEVLAALMLLVDGHSLLTSDATFAEALYGLRRRTISKTAHGKDTMSSRQRLMGLVLQVGLPYLKSKADRLYKLQIEAGPLGLALQQAARSSTSAPGGQQAAPPLPWPPRQLLRAFMTTYPYLHALYEGTSFVYQLAYLLGMAEAHRPALHVLGLQLARVSAQDMADMARNKTAWRTAQLARAAAQPGAGPVARAASALQRGALRGLHLLSDHYRHALILAVFGFKALEWWYTSAEERLKISMALPPPDPPPPPKPSPKGVGLPQDTSLCPVCRRRCTNPAQITTSGFVFCYPCAFSYIMDHACCPVTLMPATLDHVRKLYEGAV